jgi:DNA-directed RNA polymerase specialized sigma24 family protein
MKDNSSLHRDGNFAEDSSRVLKAEEHLKRLRIRLQHLLQKQAWPSKSSLVKVGPCDPDLVEEAISRAWDRFAEFQGNTPEEFLAWMFKILDDVIDESHPLS